MDQTLKNILGIAPPAASAYPKAQIAVSPKTLGALNEAYGKVGMPRGVVKTSNPAAIKFHEVAPTIIAEENRAAIQAAKRVEEDFTLAAPVKVARIVGIARMAVLAIQARLSNAAIPLLRQIQDARALVDKAMDRKPTDPTALVAWQLRVSDTRRALDDMATPARLEASKRLAERADEVWPEVFLNSIQDYLPDGQAVAMTGAYQRAFAGEQVQLLEDAQQALEEIRAIIRSVEVAVSATWSGTGLPANWKGFPTGDIVKAWPKAAQADFIAAKGPEAYADLLQGRLGLDAALGIFRSTLAGV